MVKKIKISEQTDWTELNNEEKQKVRGWADVKVVDYFNNMTPPYQIKRDGEWTDSSGIKRTLWKKRLKSTPPITSDFSKYVGDYQTKTSVKIPFKITEKEGALNISIKGVDSKLEKQTDGSFKGSIVTVSLLVTFNISNDIVTGGTIKIGNDTFDFEKGSESQNISPFGDITWAQVTYEVWKSLSNAGKWIDKKITDAGEVFLAAKDKAGNYLFPPTEDESECQPLLNCPRPRQVINGEASFKRCMKCEAIERIQSSPVFKEIYFKELDMAGKPKKIHKFFGSIMKDAVIEYQKKNGFTADGVIGQQTYAKILEELQSPPTPPKPPTPPTPAPVKPIQPKPVKKYGEEDPEYWERFFEKEGNLNSSDLDSGRKLESIYRKDNKTNMKNLIKEPIPQNEKNRILELHNMLKLSELKKRNKRIVIEQGRELDFDVPLEDSPVKKTSVILDPSNQFDYMTKVLTLCKNQVSLFRDITIDNQKFPIVRRHSEDAQKSFIKTFDRNNIGYAFYPPNKEGVGNYRDFKTIVDGKPQPSELKSWSCPAVKQQFDKQSPQTDVESEKNYMKNRGWREYHELRGPVNPDIIQTQYNVYTLKDGTNLYRFKGTDEVKVGGTKEVTDAQQAFIDEFAKMGYVYNLPINEREGKLRRRPEDLSSEARGIFDPGTYFYLDWDKAGEYTKRKPRPTEEKIKKQALDRSACREAINNWYEAYRIDVRGLKLGEKEQEKLFVQRCALSFKGRWGIFGKNLDEKIDFLSRNGSINGEYMVRDSPYYLELNRQTK